MKNKRTLLLHLLFVFYLAALTWIILFKMAVSWDTIDHGIRSLNLIPFKGAMITNGRINFSEMIDNIFVFCPFGIYIGVLYRRWNERKCGHFGSRLVSFQRNSGPMSRFSTS